MVYIVQAHIIWLRNPTGLLCRMARRVVWVRKCGSEDSIDYIVHMKACMLRAIITTYKFKFACQAKYARTHHMYYSRGECRKRWNDLLPALFCEASDLMKYMKRQSQLIVSAHQVTKNEVDFEAFACLHNCPKYKILVKKAI